MLLLLSLRWTLTNSHGAVATPFGSLIKLSSFCRLAQMGRKSCASWQVGASALRPVLMWKKKSL